MKVCYIASGGGHLRQILELKSLWSSQDAYFVSEDSVLLRTFEGPRHRLTVSPFILGEARQGARLDLVRRIARNFIESRRHVRAEHPDVVISTGAGSAFFTALFGRLSGAKVIVVESLARSTALSKFARIAGLIAHQRVLQSPALADKWPGVPVFDPIKTLPAKHFDKEDLILVTVGATLPFDRMVNAVAQLKAQGRLTARTIYQVGRGGARPGDGEVAEEFPNDVLRSLLERARIAVVHGGSGSMITALQAGCHVIAFARRQPLGEHYDDHQLELTQAFEARGLVQLAWDAESLARAIDNTASRPVTRVASDMTELANYIRDLLQNWFPQPPQARPATSASA